MSCQCRDCPCNRRRTVAEGEHDRDIPEDVYRYVEEHKDQGYEESKAWAVAWSRYCSKHPNSDHCNQEEYFPNRPEVAEGIREKNTYRTKEMSDRDLFDELVKLGNRNPGLRDNIAPVLHYLNG